ncbi:MAG: hypothetical protein Q7T01_04235 [bacterium]|nr:hypothetical protein [bacterium]
MPHKYAHLVAVNMGYGHERPAYALRELSGGEIIVANDYPGIPAEDRALWEQGRKYYETVSRLQPMPVIGKTLFHALVDHQQEIAPFYPRRDLSDVSFQLKLIRHAIVARNQGRHLIEMLERENEHHARPLPFVTTFFAPAFMAEEFGYSGEIYCLATDADIARVWAHWNPKKSRIKYFAPNGRCVERLVLYGVPRGNIYLTGFALPKELVGGEASRALKHDLGVRMANLDPNGYYRHRHGATLARHLGPHFHEQQTRPITIAFAVGGAGAQKRAAVQLLTSLHRRIKRKELRLLLIAGTRREVAQFFEKEIVAQRMHREAKRGAVSILYRQSRREYFEAFTDAMRVTDVLWTKPSELSFYTGVGIPIIMTDPIGSQEVFNRQWLQQIGGGIDQLDPAHADEWLWDWVQSGALARMAWNGYIEAPTHGTYRIESIVRGKPTQLEPHPLVV